MLDESRVVVDGVQPVAVDKVGADSLVVERCQVGYFVADVNEIEHEVPELVAKVLGSCVIEKTAGGGVSSLSCSSSRT